MSEQINLSYYKSKLAMVQIQIFHSPNYKISHGRKKIMFSLYKKINFLGSNNKFVMTQKKEI